MASSPHSSEDSGFKIICAAGSRELVAFFILKSRVKNSGSSGECKSSGKDSEDEEKNNQIDLQHGRILVMCFMSFKIRLVSLYNIHSNNITDS